MPFALFLLLIAFFCSQDLRGATLFSDGFETGLAGWLVGDNNLDPGDEPAYWGVVDAFFGGEDVHSGANKAYCAGVGFTRGSDNPRYRNYMQAYLLQSIDLTTATNATLSFWYKIPSLDLDPDNDFATVYMDDVELWSRGTSRITWTEVSLSLGRFIGGQHVLKFEFTSDSVGRFEGIYLDDVLITDAFTPGPPPVNDNFTAAQVLLGAIGAVSGSTISATTETSEPTGDFTAVSSIWYRWTAFTNGPVTFSTAGSSFDTVLCVYTGSTLNTLSPVSCDDNGESNNTSLVIFEAVRGAQYRISVRGMNDTRGAVQLNWNQPAGVGPDLLPDLGVVASEQEGYLYGWYIDKAEPTQPGRTLLRASTSTVNTGAGPLELIGSSSSPDVYQRIFRTDGSYHDHQAGTFAFHPSHGHLHFDHWLTFNLLEAFPDNSIGNIIASGDKTSFAIIDLDPYNLALPGAPTTNKYSGGLVQGISVGWGDAYGANLPDQWIDVTDVPPGRYWLEAVVDPDNRIIEQEDSNNTARILVDLTSLGAGPVPYDSFSTPIVLVGPTAGYLGSTVGASKEPDEPNHITDDEGGASVWFRWTAPSSMGVTISTDGSRFDTVLAVYIGDAVNALSPVVSDDDGGFGKASKVSFDATAGTTYQIAVDGYDGVWGGLELNFNPAWNDSLANCIPITGLFGSSSGSTRGATQEAGEALHAGVNGTNSVWFCWTAPTNTLFAFDTSGSGFDTLLAVYSGSAFPLTPVASDDNSGAFNVSRLAFQAESNVTYRIAVDGANGASGVAQLNWIGPAGPVMVAQPLATNVVAGGSASFFITVSGSPLLSFQWRHFGTNISDDGGRISGATSATLNLSKIIPSDAGSYSVVITNTYGSVTSTEANLIVLDNPRVIYVEELTGPVGGIAVLPVNMQAVGDERAANFSLLFDPATLSNPRVSLGADTAGASLSVNSGSVAEGRLGIGFAFPEGQAMATGSTRELVRVLFDVGPGALSGSVTPVGFIDQPVAKYVSATNGIPLTTLFAAGFITLQAVTATTQGERLADGTFHISMSGLPLRIYVIEANTDLATLDWEGIATNKTGLDGRLQFIDLGATNLTQRFYRALLHP